MATLVIRDPDGGRRRLPLPEGNTVIGRREDAEIRLDDARVSQRHAMITIDGEGARVVDLESRNGIMVNGHTVATAALRDGDQIWIGPTLITFEAGFGSRAGETLWYMPSWTRDMPCWAVSAGLHFILIMLLGAYVLTEGQSEEKERHLIMHREYTSPAYDPTRKRDLYRRPNVIVKKTSEKLFSRLKPDKITPDIPEGTNFESLANKNLAYRGLVDVFGLGGGVAGAYGNRLGKGSLVIEGGGEGTERAVYAALGWLLRHQNPDGSWSSHDFKKQCGKPPAKPGDVCQNKKKNRGDGRGIRHHDAGVTALAMLAFTGTGHTHLFGVRPAYVRALRKAVKYLKRVQVTDPNDPDHGRFGFKAERHWIYDQALATMALGELLVLSGDTLGLGACVESAARFCLRAQNKGLGWRYGVRPGDNDTSVTGWMILALKACKAAPLTSPTVEEYEQAFRDALQWLDRATDQTTGSTGYQSAKDRRPHSVYCMTAVGVLCRIFAGQSRADPVILKGVDYILRELPEWRDDGGRGGANKINFYYWYYGSYALFQFGGQPWNTWNVAMKKALLESQRQGGCEDGSWDPVSQWGQRGGRVYSTALAAMTLEVYYRFVRAQGGF